MPFNARACVGASSSMSSTMSSGSGSAMTSINWEDFNYPPMLHLWHYDPRELDYGPRMVARIAHAALLFALLGLAINLVVNVGLMTAADGNPIYVFYAVCNLLLGCLIGTWATMTGYKGIATNKAKLMRRYLWIWGVLTLGMAIAGLNNLINYNGWARVLQLLDTPAPKGNAFWLGGAIVESSVWTIACFVSLVAWTFTYKIFDRGPTAVRWMGNRI